MAWGEDGIGHPDRVGASSDTEGTEKRGMRMGEEETGKEGRLVPFWDSGVCREVTPPPGVFL